MYLKIYKFHLLNMNMFKPILKANVENRQKEILFFINSILIFQKYGEVKELFKSLKKINFKIKEEEMKKIEENKEIDKEMKKFFKKYYKKPQDLKIVLEQVAITNQFIRNLIVGKYDSKINKIDYGLKTNKIKETLKELNFTKMEQIAYVNIKKWRKIKEMSILKIMMPLSITKEMNEKDRLMALIKIKKEMLGKNFKEIKKIVLKKIGALIKDLKISKEGEYVLIKLLLPWLMNNGLLNGKTFNIIKKVMDKIHSLFSGIKAKEMEMQYLGGLLNIVKNSGDFKGINIEMYSNAFMVRLDEV